MAILNWTQYNPSIRLAHTTKKYFNKYLCKLVIYAPAGRLITRNDDLQLALNRRQGQPRAAGYPQWKRFNSGITDANISFLECMRTLKQDTTLAIKMSICEPQIQLYAENEQTLFDLVGKYIDPAHYQYITEIYRPESDAATDVLNANGIIRKTKAKYSHKIIFRDGLYDAAIKANLIKYLNGLDATIIRIPKTVSNALSNNSGYVWNLCVYTNDPSIVMFINIIHPHLVRNCHAVVTINNK